MKWNKNVQTRFFFKQQRQLVAPDSDMCGRSAAFVLTCQHTPPSSPGRNWQEWVQSSCYQRFPCTDEIRETLASLVGFKLVNVWERKKRGQFRDAWPGWRILGNTSRQASLLNVPWKSARTCTDTHRMILAAREETVVKSGKWMSPVLEILLKGKRSNFQRFLLMKKPHQRALRVNHVWTGPTLKTVHQKKPFSFISSARWLQGSYLHY